MYFLIDFLSTSTLVLEDGLSEMTPSARAHVEVEIVCARRSKNEITLSDRVQVEPEVAFARGSNRNSSFELGSSRIRNRFRQTVDTETYFRIGNQKFGFLLEVNSKVVCARRSTPKRNSECLSPFGLI